MKTVVMLIGFASFVILIAIGCQKILDEPSFKVNAEFDAAFVKEWYYGTFKKSSEWLSSVEHGKKIPDWKHPVYKKIGNIKIIEYPLIKANKKIPVLSEKFLPLERVKLSEASVDRIVFVQKNDGKISVRELSFIPEWDYLKSNNFDIIDEVVSNNAKNFIGQLLVNDWSGKQVSKWQIHNGSFKKIKRKINAPVNTSSNIINQTSNIQNCVTYLITEYERNCEYTSFGEGVSVYHCSEWIPTGLSWYEEVCDAEDPCEGFSEEQCACMVYGVCNGDEEEDCSITSISKLSELSNNSTTSNETISVSTISEQPEVRTKKYEWIILKNIGWHLFSFDKGIHVATANPDPTLKWNWQSFEHQNISRVGIVIGGNVEYALISATPTIGLYNAVMDLDFKVTYSIICKGSPFSTELTYNSNKLFHVND